MPETYTPSAPDTDTQEIVRTLKHDALSESQTAGDFARNMRALAPTINSRGQTIEHAPVGLDSPSQARVRTLSAEKREEVADLLADEAATAEKAVQGNEDLHLDTRMERGLLGLAEVNGGRQTVRMNAKLVMDLSTPEGERQFTNVAAHELDHATDQKMMAHGVRTDSEITQFHMHELASEDAGAKALGEGSGFRREGQPEDYREAQDKGDEMAEWGVSMNQFEARIRDGDADGLQEDLIEGGLNRGKLQVEDLAREADKAHGEGNEYYAQAAIRVLQRRYSGQAQETIRN